MGFFQALWKTVLLPPPLRNGASLRSFNLTMARIFLFAFEIFGRTNFQVPIVPTLGARGLVKMQIPGCCPRDSDLAGYGVKA